MIFHIFVVVLIVYLGEKLKKRMSPWGLVTEEETFIAGRKHISYDIGGVSQLDYLDLYKKFTYKAQESYRLDYIASVELGQKKLDHSVSLIHSKISIQKVGRSL